MAMLRFLGSIFLLVATLSLIHDVHQSLSSGIGFLVTPLGQTWFDLSPRSLETTVAAAERKIPWLWTYVIVTLLQYPAWASFGLLGAGICYLGRERKRTNIYAN